MDCQVTARLNARAYRSYRLDAIFAGHKWDPQIHDRSAIADRALVLSADDWNELSATTEALYRETLDIETRLFRFARDPAAKRFLPPRAWRRLRSLPDFVCRDAVRLMRFDFHPTENGWRLSEVNSDVPGGLNESSNFPELWPTKSADWGVAGNPGLAYVERVTERYELGPDALVGLVHATAYSDDWQHMAFLQGLFARAGIEAIGVAPTNVELRGGRMSVGGAALTVGLRFFPGDWLLFSPWGERWFAEHPANLSNPLSALFSQNKFFPVICAALGISTPTWQRYLPPTAELRLKDLLGSAGLIKPSFGRVGEDVERISNLSGGKKLTVALDLVLGTGLWIRQEPFRSKNLGSDSDPINACVGVYCLDGRVVGGYGRISAEQFIGVAAADSPVFIAH